jgi:hypothetical protein
MVVYAIYLTRLRLVHGGHRTRRRSVTQVESTDGGSLNALGGIELETALVLLLRSLLGNLLLLHMGWGGFSGVFEGELIINAWNVVFPI